MVTGPTKTDMINEIIKLEPDADRGTLYNHCTRAQLKRKLDALRKRKGISNVRK